MEAEVGEDVERRRELGNDERGVDLQRVLIWWRASGESAPRGGPSRAC